MAVQPVHAGGMNARGQKSVAKTKGGGDQLLQRGEELIKIRQPAFCLNHSGIGSGEWNVQFKNHFLSPGNGGYSRKEGGQVQEEEDE